MEVCLLYTVVPAGFSLGWLDFAPPSPTFWFTEEPLLPPQPLHVITMQSPHPQLFAFQGWGSKREPSGPVSISVHSGLYPPDLQELSCGLEDQAKQEGGVLSPGFVFVFKIITDVVPLSGLTVTYNIHI